MLESVTKVFTIRNKYFLTPNLKYHHSTEFIFHPNKIQHGPCGLSSAFHCTQPALADWLGGNGMLFSAMFQCYGIAIKLCITEVAD